MTYKTQMRNYTDIMALQCKDCGEKTTLKCKELPKYDSIPFFHDRKYCTVANPEMSFLCFSGVATATNLFLSTSNSLPTCWYSSIPGVFSIVFLSWRKDFPCCQSLLLGFQENILHDYEKNEPSHSYCILIFRKNLTAVLKGHNS